MVRITSNARTVRALEVILTTGRRFSDQRSSVPPETHNLTIGLTRPRDELYLRLDQRIDAMLRAGFVQEVERLLARGYSPELPTLSAIGYGEIAAHLMGKITLDEAVAEMKRRTRIFVRRQANWFKPGDPHIQWFPAGAENLAQIEQFIQTWLSNHLTT